MWWCELTITSAEAGGSLEPGIHGQHRTTSSHLTAVYDWVTKNTGLYKISNNAVGL